MATLPLSLGPEVPSRRPIEARTRRPRPWLWFLLVAVLYWSFAGVQFNLGELIGGVPQMQDWLRQSLPPDATTITDLQRYGFPPEFTSVLQLNPFAQLEPVLAEIRERWWANTFPQTVVGATLQTIQMAVAGTVIAVPFSLPFAFLAARNTSPHHLVYHAVKLMVNVLRSIPDFAVGLMLITAIGLGPFTGTMALAFHT
jgi:ABC-type phosphate/phosphonate transport system permease subunit